MTDTTTIQQVTAEVPQVSTNPALLQFPQDKWGYTSKMRKELLAAASTIKGQPDKLALFLATLDIIREHATARFEIDVQTRHRVGEDAARYAAQRHEYRGSGRASNS